MTAMNAPACAACNRQTLAHDVVAGQYFCGNAGCREYLITRSAPEIAQLRDRLTRASVPRTSMDPQLDDVKPSPLPRDPDTFDMFGDPKPEPKGPADSIPTNDEGREATGRFAQDDLGREEGRR